MHTAFPAQPAQPAQDYKTFRLGFLFGVEFSQIKYTYDYTYQTGAGSPFFNGTSSKTLTTYGVQLGLSAYVTPVSFFHINFGGKVGAVRGSDSSVSGKDILAVGLTPFVNFGFRLGRLGPLGMFAPFVGANYTKYVGILNFDKNLDYSFISAVGGLEFMEDKSVFGLSYEHRVVALDSGIRDLTSWRANLYMTFLFGG